jgi:S-formylglutathione hydrolase FrmB
MPLPFPHPPQADRGRTHLLEHASAALIGNPLGDPAVRDVYVHEPKGCEGRPLPAILILPGYAGTGEKLLARGLSDVSMATRVDRLVAAGCPPFRAVLPDVMTSLGGSQYVDSAGIGAYATWLADELPAFLAAKFPTTGWGVAGKSSGGFGALHLALTRPAVFAAVACHSGDLGFDLCYLADLVPAMRAMAAAGSVERFVAAFWAKDEPSHVEFAGLNLLCMATAYGRRLPFDLAAGTVDHDVLRGWSALDPVVRDVEPFRGLKALFLDCGDRDEHGLQFGARRLAARLRDAGIAHVHEEFPGGHRNTSGRWDRSLPILAGALS